MTAQHGSAAAGRVRWQEGNTLRLAVIAIAPAPYRNGLFNRLAQEPDITLRVFYLQGRDSLRGWTSQTLSHAAHYVPCLTPERAYSWPLLGAVNPKLTSSLEGYAPDVLLVYGHSFWAQYGAMRWALGRRIPYLMRCDSNLYNRQFSRNGGPPRLQRIKERVLGYFASRAAGVLSIGTSNDRFWEHYGVGSDRRFRAAFAVDNEFFHCRATGVEGSREIMRSDIGLGPGRLLLFAGRLIPAKNLDRLLEAWGKAQEPGHTLLLVGSGPEARPLRRKAAELGLANVRFRSFQTQEEIANLYAGADGLILPSVFEPWGLVVNEAMACGLPVLVSQRCGCAADLLRDGENGYGFDPSSQESISSAIRRFLNLPEASLRKFGSRSRELIDPWNYEAAVGGIRKALHAVAGL